MEPHSLVLLSGSTLDACHHMHMHGTQTRRVQPVLPRRPFRHLAQSLARLLPPLRQLRQRLRPRTSPSTSEESSVVARTWTATTEHEVATASPPCSLLPSSQPQFPHPCNPPRSQAPRWGRKPRPPLQEAQLPQTQLRTLPKETEAERLEQQVPLQQVQEAGDLPQGMEQLKQHHPLAAHCHRPSLQRRRGPLRRLGRLFRIAASHMRPQGPGENDKNLPERILNVATCGMFFQAGGKIVRLCHSLAARRFGWAFVAVGLVATVYHGSWGRVRPLARKVDYYSIAACSLLLRSAVVGPVPGWLAAAMLAAIPFKPTLVSSSNFMAVEVRYLLLALAQRRMLAAWAAHSGLSAAATACFTLEQTPLLSWFPYTHAAFHVFSAAAFLTLPSALNHLAG